MPPLSEFHMLYEITSQLYTFDQNVTTLRLGLCCRNSFCRLSVTLVHPLNGLKFLAIFLNCCVR